jgi:hypothetical protein
MYFGPVEEEAVKRYLASTDQRERNEIYNLFLYKPLNKMIESIIRRYGLYRKSVSFEELHTDTLSFLITKAHKFDSTRSKRAYSYYGTICKNYLLGMLIKDEKQLKQLLSYEDMYENIQERSDLAYTMDPEMFESARLIKNISTEIKEELVAIYDPEDLTQIPITDNERKVGEALSYILDNWENILNFSAGNKYNKNSILSCIRESTNLNTKDIRNAMKRFKKIYSIVLEETIKADD